MNKLFFIAFIFLPLISQANSKQVRCQSYDIINGWTGIETNDYVQFNAVVVSNTSLKNAKINGAFESDSRDLNANLNYKPRNAKYIQYNKFDVLEDSWCWFAPLMPKNIAEKSKGEKFVGYIQLICEDARKQKSFGMSCAIE